MCVNLPNAEISLIVTYNLILLDNIISLLNLLDNYNVIYLIFIRSLNVDGY